MHKTAGTAKGTECKEPRQLILTVKFINEPVNSVIHQLRLKVMRKLISCIHQYLTYILADLWAGTNPISRNVP